jgi:hypothetical protein
MSISHSPRYIGTNPLGVREEPNGTYSFKTADGAANRAIIGNDGIENSGLFINKSTLGTGSETITVASDEGAYMVGPITVNCTLTVNGTLRVI